MNIRLCISAGVAVLISACTDQVAGQKGQAALKTTLDSISYGIGTQVGQNLRDQFRGSDMDSLNNAALAAGLRDALDSTMIISSEKVTTLVQTYMIDIQKKNMAKQQAIGEAALREGEAWLLENGKKPGVMTTASGLQYEVVKAGTGPKPTKEDMVNVNYRGTLLNGKPFDSSYDRGEPATFAVGGQIIPGWTEALQLMPVGSTWKIYIPQNLAWGAQGAGEEIPPYSAVIFDLELISIATK